MKTNFEMILKSYNLKAVKEIKDFCAKYPAVIQSIKIDGKNAGIEYGYKAGYEIGYLDAINKVLDLLK